MNERADQQKRKTDPEVAGVDGYRLVKTAHLRGRGVPRDLLAHDAVESLMERPLGICPTPPAFPD